MRGREDPLLLARRLDFLVYTRQNAYLHALFKQPVLRTLCVLQKANAGTSIREVFRIRNV